MVFEWLEKSTSEKSFGTNGSHATEFGNKQSGSTHHHRGLS